MQWLALLSLLAVSSAAAAVIAEPPIIVDPFLELLLPYVRLPGWQTCPDHCVIAIPDKTLSAIQEPVCFEEPAHVAPCSYYYCCGEPVSSS